MKDKEEFLLWIWFACVVIGLIVLFRTIWHFTFSELGIKIFLTVAIIGYCCLYIANIISKDKK